MSTTAPLARGYEPRNRTSSDVRRRPIRASADACIRDVARCVDGETVLAERRPDRPRLNPGEVDATNRELLQQLQQGTRPVLVDEDDERGLVGAGARGRRRRDARPARSASPRRGGRRCWSRASRVGRSLRRSAPRSPRRRASRARPPSRRQGPSTTRAPPQPSGRFVAIHRRHCASPCGWVATRRTSSIEVPGLASRAKSTVTSISRVIISGSPVKSAVDRHRHHALDRVLDRHDGTVDLAVAHGVERRQDRVERDLLASRGRGYLPQSRLGERAGGAEIGETGGRDSRHGSHTRRDSARLPEIVCLRD